VLEPRRDGTNIWYRLKSKEAAEIMKILGVRALKKKAQCC